MARDEGASVLFLYVVDVEFLRLTARGVRPEVVAAELEQMGEFLLAIACERAAAQGVQAEMCVRHGELVPALESAAVEEGADAIAFGRPAGPYSAFSLEDLQQMASRIQEEIGIRTYIV
jgi:nucleotide-binding universal stress UspA family protein